MTLKLEFGVTQGHRKRHNSIERIQLVFIFVFHSNYASISYRFRDIAAYWSKIATPLYLAPPFGGEADSFEQRPLVSVMKTRMMDLSDSGRISMIRSAVLTHGRTDGIGVAYTRYGIYAVALKN